MTSAYSAPQRARLGEFMPIKGAKLCQREGGVSSAVLEISYCPVHRRCLDSALSAPKCRHCLCEVRTV